MRSVQKLIFIIFLVVGAASQAKAYDCSPSDITLNTQAEVDALGASGCDNISGDLEIFNLTFSDRDITNIDSLVNLISIEGNLSINGTRSITHIDGLINLKSVGGYLNIFNNDALTSIDGLTNLSSVGGYLGIDRNDVLTEIDGLSYLQSIGGDLWINNNEVMTSINGLPSLASLGGYLSVEDNNGLQEIDGLTNLKSIQSYLAIQRNDALTSINGLSSLTSVGADPTRQQFVISGNVALTSIDGLVNLESVVGSMVIRRNGLTNIDGLANLTSVGKQLNISVNPALTNINSLVNLTSVGEDLRVGYNDTLTSLDGLTGLESIGHSLYVEHNKSLKNIDGLSNLTSVKWSVYFNNNEVLTDLDGLANVTSLWAVYIDNNDALRNVDGLANVTSLRGNYLEIYSNTSLDGCEGVAQLLGWPNGPSEDTFNGKVESNRTGCNSVEEVLSSVSGPTKPTIIGTLTTESESILRLEFTPSTTTDDLFPVTGYRAACIGSFSDLNESPAAALLDNTPVIRTLSVTGYDPVSVRSAIEVDIDITHSDTQHLYITLTAPDGTELTLHNQTNQLSLVGTFPTTIVPFETISTDGLEMIDGDWILRVEDVLAEPANVEGVLNSWGLRVTEEVFSSGTASPIDIPDVIAGRDYSCTIAPVTTLGASPASDSFAASPLLDNDSDSDGLNDNIDNCPSIANEDQADFDSDGEGDACDADDDNDGTSDEDDAFPFDDTESLDTDGDGVGNNEDEDDDGDGFLDDSDPQPIIANVFAIDSDGDGVADSIDDYPTDATKQFGSDGDFDGDGYSNDEEVDYCTNPFDKNSQPELGGLSLPLIKVITEQ